MLGALTADDRAEVRAAGLDLAPVSLQQLIVRLTQKAETRSGTRADATTEGVR